MEINANNMKKYVQAPVKVNECQFWTLGRKRVSPVATIWRFLGFWTKKTASRYRLL